MAGGKRTCRRGGCPAVSPLGREPTSSLLFAPMGLVRISPSHGTAIGLALFTLLSASVVRPVVVTGLSAQAGLGLLPEQPICDPAHGPSLGARFAPIGGVSLFDGSYDMEMTDIGDSTSMATTFTRAYLSIDTRTTLLGPGWTNNFQVRLTQDGITRDLLLTLPNGNVERFKGALDSDRSIGTSRGYRVLSKQQFGRMLVTDIGITWTFGAGGTLERVDDASGDWVEVGYDEHTRLASTNGPAGPGLRFDVGPDDRLVQVTNAADPTDFVRYEYDAAGRLIRAALSSGFGDRFAYDGDTQRITTISDDEGSVLLALEYDDKGRVVRDRDAQGLMDGEAVTFDYEDLPDGEVRTTVVYPPSLVERTWHPVQTTIHDSQGRLRELQLEPTSTQTLTGQYDYDPENRRIVLKDPCPRPLPAGHSYAIGSTRWLLILLILSVFGFVSWLLLGSPFTGEPRSRKS